MGQNLWLMAGLVLTAGVGLVLSLLNLLGASWYDLIQTKQEKERLRHPFAKRFNQKPLISVIIPSHNKAAALERTLGSIIRSSYRKFEVIVVDDGSTDNTKKTVKDFTKANSRQTIRLLSRRRSIGHAGAINDGFKKRAKGELILALGPGSALDRHALRNIVRHFVAGDISILAPCQRVMEYPSIVSLLQQFKQLVWLRPKKLSSVINAEWDASGPGVVYSSEAFKKLKGFKNSLIKPDTALSLAAASYGNKKFQLRYASDVVVFTEPELSYKSLVMERYRHKLGTWQALRVHKSLFLSRNKNVAKSLAWFRLPMFVWGELMVLLEPLVVAYFIYLAIAFGQPILAAIGWAAVSFLLVFTIWADNQLPLRQKAKLTAYLPIMYPLLLVMTLIDIAATVMSLLNIKRTTSSKKKPRTPKKRPQSAKKLAPQT